jgi:hypothetical protein
LNSTCPRLLLEPQRTNLSLYSEQLNDAAWGLQGSTVTANATTSPDGYSNADAVVEDSSTGEHNRITYGTLTAASYTASVFLKKYNETWCAVYLYNGSVGIRHWINLDTLTAGTSAAINAGITAPLTLTNYGNGWVRASMTWTADVTTWSFYVACARTNGGATNYAGNGTSGFYAWGSQIEAGAYATSYIPTLGTSVTRVADAASKTGITSLIGQTEGVMFIDMEFDAYDSLAKWIAFLGTGSAYVGIYTDNVSRFVAEVANSGVSQFLSSTYTFSVGQRYKLAIAYKANDFAFYVNGTQVATDNSGTVPATSRFDLQYNTTANNLTARTYNQALLFKTRLSNSDLAALTTL